MIRTAIGSLSLMLLGGVVLTAPAAPAASGADPVTGPLGRAVAATDIQITDRYDMVVYARHRPIRVRVNTGAEGKPLAERWRTVLKSTFDYFDRDGNGFISESEVRFIFSDTGLTQLLQNGIYTPAPQDTPTLERLDRNGDQRVSFDEFALYYRQGARYIMRALPPRSDDTGNAQLTEAFFKLLDRNNDGKLTRDEVMAVETLLPTRDEDEDECLSMGELVPSLGNRDPRLRAVPVSQPPSRPLPANTSLLAVYDAGQVPGSITQRVFQEYDKNGDYELTPAEIAFDPQTFARLDTDRSGTLSGEEVDTWRTGEPDLEVSLVLAANPADCKADLKTDPKVAEARGFSVRQADRGRVVVVSARQVIDLGAMSLDPRASRRVVLKEQYNRLFQFASAGKGYVEEKDLTGQNAAAFQLLRVWFDPADRDGDGKLTQAEFDRYSDLQQSFFEISLGLTPSLQTPSLFDLLDDNRDGKLGVRELRTAWDRLIALEPSGGAEVTRAVIQPAVSLRLTRATDQGLVNQRVVVAPGVNGNLPVSVPTRGPVWFRKMDRNGDGDVSRSEFLGTKTEFDAIDTDHDGLISLTEADAHDKKMRTAEK